MSALDDVPVLRCERSGNPCGTDTWRVGSTCQCAPCRTWVALETYRERLAEAEKERDFFREVAANAQARADASVTYVEFERAAFQRVADEARKLFPPDADMWDSPRMKPLRAALAELDAQSKRPASSEEERAMDGRQR